MSGHPSFNHTIEEANIWLKAVAERLHFEDRRHAYSALRATLHALRDRLAPESAVHMSAQLPMLIRGLFFEGWKMRRILRAHFRRVAAGLPDGSENCGAGCVRGDLDPARCRRNGQTG
ncbi:DUF2267 domain-containing protein [Devosia nitrariae]|uniref:DUF2267 domain-containing protein n=2 Tax=Devosia nitrariae TaxID=2071872 RepID=A0ABQ5W9G9_9HYPH|nr:hypothetical protein GCM10010862_38390 [Devosia nitrariae]